MDRRRVLLVLLLALLAMAGATAPAAAEGVAAQNSALAPDTPATHHDLRDWLRLPAVNRQALSTPVPDSWPAVCATSNSASALPDCSLACEAAGAAIAIAVAATPSTRAPPVRVS